MVRTVVLASLLATGLSNGPSVQEIRPHAFAASPRFTAEIPGDASTTSKRAYDFLDQRGFLIFTEGLPNTITTLSGNRAQSQDAKCARGVFVAEENLAVALQVTLTPGGDGKTIVSVASEYVAWRRGWIAKIMSTHSVNGRWFLKPKACVTTGRVENQLIDDLRQQ